MSSRISRKRRRTGSLFVTHSALKGSLPVFQQDWLQRCLPERQTQRVELKQNSPPPRRLSRSGGRVRGKPGTPGCRRSLQHSLRGSAQKPQKGCSEQRLLAGRATKCVNRHVRPCDLSAIKNRHGPELTKQVRVGVTNWEPYSRANCWQPTEALWMLYPMPAFLRRMKRSQFVLNPRHISVARAWILGTLSIQTDDSLYRRYKLYLSRPIKGLSKLVRPPSIHFVREIVSRHITNRINVENIFGPLAAACLRGDPLLDLVSKQNWSHLIRGEGVQKAGKTGRAISFGTARENFS